MNFYGKAGCSDFKKKYIEIKDLFTFTVTLLFIFLTNELYNNTRTWSVFRVSILKQGYGYCINSFAVFQAAEIQFKNLTGYRITTKFTKVDISIVVQDRVSLHYGYAQLQITAIKLALEAVFTNFAALYEKININIIGNIKKIIKISLKFKNIRGHAG